MKNCTFSEVSSANETSESKITKGDINGGLLVLLQLPHGSIGLVQVSLCENTNNYSNYNNIRSQMMNLSSILMATTTATTTVMMISVLVNPPLG